MSIGRRPIPSTDHRGQSTPSSLHRKIKCKKEIEVLDSLCCNDKTAIDDKLKFLDKGGLTYPVPELIPFLQNYSIIMKSTLNHAKLEEIGSEIFKVRNIV